MQRYITCLLGLACSRNSAPAAPPGASTAAVLPNAPSVSCEPLETPARLPMPERLVAIGDVHGDLAATRRVLRLAGILDGNDKWVGGATVVVQTGDVLDRGDDEGEIIALFERLEVDSAAAGGRFIWLLGNHELMNGAGDFRYVTPNGMADFDTGSGGEAGRRAAFLPGGAMATILGRQRTSIIVGDIVFAHAGFRSEWAENAETMSGEDACWLLGGDAKPRALLDSESPVWTRVFGYEAPCKLVAESLAALGAKRMVVGHTVQPNGITMACDQTLFRIDVGMSAHYGGKASALEFLHGVPRVLR